MQNMHKYLVDIIMFFLMSGSIIGVKPKPNFKDENSDYSHYFFSKNLKNIMKNFWPKRTNLKSLPNFFQWVMMTFFTISGKFRQNIRINFKKIIIKKLSYSNQFWSFQILKNRFVVSKFVINDEFLWTQCF